MDCEKSMSYDSMTKFDDVSVSVTYQNSNNNQQQSGVGKCPILGILDITL